MGIITYVEQTELAALFVYAAALGCVFGALFDLFRILRRATRFAENSITSALFVFFQDILFFLIATAASAIFFYKFNSGRIRLSAIAFMIGGFAAYYFTVGRLVMAVADAIIAFIKELIRRFCRLLLFLFSPIATLAAAAFARIEHAIRLILLSAYTKQTLVRYNKLLYK